MSKERLIIESMFRIANKEGEDVDFRLNAEQALLDANLSGRDLVPKARQMGISSYVLARFTAKCMMHRNRRAVVISHESEATERMLSKVQYFIKHIKGPAPVISNMSKNEIVFPKMDSMFYIGTAGSRAFGRGDTITDLHCSEYAYWPNPKQLMGGLLQAVPKSGEVIVESTGNGMNDYYRRCIRSAKGLSRYKLHFFPWHHFAEYQEAVPADVAAAMREAPDLDLEEDKLLHLLTPEQMMWRRYKLEELNYDMPTFKQEYPITLDECFQASGDSIFSIVRYEETPRWKKEDRHGYILEGHPQPGYVYSLGADVGGGIGKDASTIEVVCIDTNEQVAEWVNDRVQPDHFAAYIEGYGRRFNDAFVTVENNNYGIATLAVLDKSYPPHLMYSKTARGEEAHLLNLGYRTTVRTKPLMISNFQKLVASTLTLHSPILRAEMTTYIEDENGRLGAEEGCHDDTVIGMACACMGLTRADLYARLPLSPERRGEPDPFSGEAIIKELTGRGSSFPISRQDGYGYG